MYVILGSHKVVEGIQKHLELWGKDVKVIRELEELKDIKKIDALITFQELGKVIQGDFPVMIYTDIEQGDMETGGDVLFTPGSMIAPYMVREAREYESMRLTEDLINHIRSMDHMTVFLHDNPDPDAIASAMAFRELCSAGNKRCHTYYSGEIGYPENELFVEITGFDMENVGKEDIPNILDLGRPLVFLDFSQPGVNNSLPKDSIPSIVIDHHSSVPPDTTGYVQIDPGVGATSTLMTEHLMNLGTSIEPLMASALLYGIKVDTHGFIKNMSKSDFRAMETLLGLCDTELYHIFEKPVLNRTTMSSLGMAIMNREVSNGVMTAYAGDVRSRDDIPQIAELLVTENDVHTAMVLGKIDEVIYMSSRSTLKEIHLGHIMDQAFSDIGEAGGHPHAAAGMVALGDGYHEKDMIKDLSNRFRKEMRDHA